MKVREGGRVTGAVVLVATGVNGDGHREVLGLRVATSETGAAWNSFFADARDEHGRSPSSAP
ncbi:transposase-like protein [Microbacterium immunditiarum]|uniref:Mutator family transposase n=1 Tax=Microbacterium immunditiarum TaxID=337480 RepID=A0A7Y9GRU2_9MICO|nr:transposase-like protein [Microbacterium immunditiarum]